MIYCRRLYSTLYLKHKIKQLEFLPLKILNNSIVVQYTVLIPGRWTENDQLDKNSARDKQFMMSTII